MWNRRWSRRSAAKTGLLGAAALTGGGLWAAGAGAAAPTRGSGSINLIVSVAYQGAGNFQGVVQELVDKYIAENWTRTHPGVSITTVAGMGCNGNCLTAGQEIAASLAGQPTDVIAGCCDMLAQFYAGDTLLPLDPYLRQYNVDLTDFSPGHLAALHTDKGQMALPEYDDPQIMLVNEGMLDDLGLPYPHPGWTYEDGAKLWQAAAGVRKGKQYYGVGLEYQSWDANDVPLWLVKAFGGEKSNAAGTRSLLNSNQVFDAANWAIPLIWNKVATPNNGSYYVSQGNLAMATSGGGDVQGSAVRMRPFKWNYYPMPTFPSGQPSTFINNDFYGINQYSNKPRDLVWDIFQFITMDNGLARLLYRLTFITPNRKSLWPDWIQLVRSVAPDLQNVNLETKIQALDYGWSTDFMRYEPLQAQAIQAEYWQRMMNRQVDLRTGLEQMTRQINALEAQGPQLQAAQRGELAAFLTDVKKAEAAKGAIAFPSPPKVGSGTAATAAGKLVQVNAAKGFYTLTGDGSGGVNGSGDNCVFAGAAYTESLGTFTCRLVSLTPAKGSKPSDIASGAKIGLMARDSLGNTAASLGVEFAKDRGLHFHQRAVDGDPLFVDSHAGSAPGLLHQASVQSTATAAGSNLLLKPVWFRLALQVDHWTPYTSTDGKAWTAAGTATPVDFVGAWVGLFASSHTTGHDVVAVFDHVTGFTPNTFVQIGSA